ncbi:MAG TPA: hypothetical protein DCZ01_00525 [Elusimicrobia bacterium]|nr:hypothetical protein [Elusimicrobiota bacterium]
MSDRDRIGGLVPKVTVVFKELGCGFKCPFCDVWANDASDAPPDLTELSDAVQTLLEGQKQQDVLECVLSGPEPLASPVFFKVLAAARRLGYANIRLNTNGIRLADRALTQQLARCGIRGVDIPVYGSNAKLHDRMTGMAGSFILLMKAIDNLRNCPGIRIEVVHTVILKQNLRDLSKLCARTKDLGLPKLEIWMPFARPSANELSRLRDICPSLTDVGKALRRIPSEFYRFLGMPLCLCPPQVPLGVSLRGFQYARKCQGCTMRAACVGVRESYLLLYGDKELRPFR